ncbi:MAG: hypothetical protein U9R05_09775, partial [Chloroflexota bacterium]|nr:hypothetical protein [Chloroflexota bacterium]
WFEDGVGNISTAPATDSVTLLAPVSISPYEPTLDLATTSTQVFAVDGNDDPYDWEIIEETPDTEGDDVAHFAEGTDSTSTNSVTVEILNPGTFKLQATPTGEGDVLISGTIMVVEGTVSKTCNLLTTDPSLTNINTVGFIFTNTGITMAHELGTSVGDCDMVSKWVVDTQSYLSHPMDIPTYNNFDLEVGEVYFVSVTADHDFTLTGKVPSSLSISLITTDPDKTNITAVGLPESKASLTDAHELGQNIGDCDMVSKWVVDTQSYLSHPMAIPTYNNFTIEWGQGYFVSVTSNTEWAW